VINMSDQALSDLTVAAIQAEATRAHARHGAYSMLSPSYTSGQRLAILAEEVGEAQDEALREAHAVAYALEQLGRASALGVALGRVGHELTYDAGGPGVGEGRREQLVRELIQVAAMAASWVEYLEGRRISDAPST
jgi:hypothetical protein